MWCLAATARAQPTNVSHYETLALRCLGAVPDTVRVFRLDAPEAMPYLRTALVGRWQAEGRTVYLSDATQGPALPWLHYAVEEVRVAYARAGGRHLGRTVTLALRYVFTAADGRLLRERRCRDTLTDTIPRDALPLVETPAFPETQAPPPETGWFRRILEPAVITAATAVGVYLFFSLRSDRSDGG